MIRKFFTVCFGLFAVVLTVGCGGSEDVGTTAGQDELSRWAAENPAPPEIPLTDGGVSASK